MNDTTTSSMLGGSTLEEVQQAMAEYAEKHRNAENALPEAIRQINADELKTTISEGLDERNLLHVAVAEETEKNKNLQYSVAQYAEQLMLQNEMEEGLSEQENLEAAIAEEVNKNQELQLLLNGEGMQQQASRLIDTFSKYAEERVNDKLESAGAVGSLLGGVGTALGVANHLYRQDLAKEVDKAVVGISDKNLQNILREKYLKDGARGAKSIKTNLEHVVGKNPLVIPTSLIGGMIGGNLIGQAGYGAYNLTRGESEKMANEIYSYLEKRSAY